MRIVFGALLKKLAEAFSLLASLLATLDLVVILLLVNPAGAGGVFSARRPHAQCRTLAIGEEGDFVGRVQVGEEQGRRRKWGQLRRIGSEEQ